MNEFFGEYKKVFIKSFVFLVLVIAVFFTIKVILEVKNHSIKNNQELGIISVSGKGEVQAVPDIANISFTIRKESKLLKDAQGMVSEVEKNVLSFLREKGVEDKDIKASNISFYPKTEYKQERVVCNEFGCPPSYGGKSVIYAYEVSENISIKVRNTEIIGDVVEGLSALGITELNGPNFVIDNEEKVKADARALAIKDAKDKARILARDLGVRLVKIKSFNESSDYMPYYNYARAESAMDLGSSMKSTLELPKGENTITSNVSIVYEIR